MAYFLVFLKAERPEEQTYLYLYFPFIFISEKKHINIYTSI